jgi:membrane protein
MRPENLGVQRGGECRRLASRTLFVVIDLLIGVGVHLLRQYARSWLRSLKQEVNHYPDPSRKIYTQSERDLNSDQKSSENKPAKHGRRAAGPAGILNLLKTAFMEWSRDKCPQLGAALAYYTVFSLAPLVLVLLAVFGLVYGGSDQAREKITDQLRYLVDPSGLKVIQDIANNAANPKASILATAMGILIALFGASGIFGQLQDALNTIWSVKSKPGQGIWSFVRARFLSFAMVGGICFLLLVSLTVESLLAGLHNYLQSILPGGHYLGLGIFYIFDLAIVTLLFAMLFRFLPDARIAWHDVWTGAALTALLFTVGKFLLGIYLSTGAAGSAYGAASSLITLLLWIFYSAQIFLFGAEFTKVYANTYGSHVEPEEHAVKVERREIELRAHSIAQHLVPATKLDSGKQPRWETA